MTQNTYIGILVATIFVLFAGAGVWFFFNRGSSPATQTNTPNNVFGSSDNTTNTTNTNTPNNNPQNIATPAGSTTPQKIFQITQGPVVGATLIQTLHPTTTLARYIDQNDGHVYDLPLDVPGAVPRVVSNVTIPGAVRALWVEGGQSALLQYLDNSAVKTIYLGFPPATTTQATLPTKILFLPDGIVDIAASPDGKSVAYFLYSANGVDGYTAKSDGTASKKLFSLPLSQMLISWPSQAELLVQTKSAAGAPGMVFAVDAKSGSVVPLVYAQGITATANKDFTKIIYQTVQDGATPLSYTHDVKSGLESKLAFNPFPEKCIWGVLATSTTMYCAAPLQSIPANYLDMWHQGGASQPDTIYTFSTKTNIGQIFVIPGSFDGGQPTDILQMALSPNEHYLSFTSKGGRSLWGVRLGSNP